MPVSLPRPALLGIAGLVLVMAAFLATRGSGGDPGGGADAGTTTPPLTSQAQLERERAAKGKADKPASKAAPGDNDVGAVVGVPTRVARALGERKVVVLLFTQRGPADDTATRLAVSQLRKDGSKAAVFTDSIAHLERYRRIVADLGVSQAPSVVIIDRQRRASLHEGYMDDASLRQLVRDARR